MTRWARGFPLLLLLLLLWGGCAAPYSVRHRVGAGEDLAAVAARYGVPERELRDFNRLEAGDRVRPGDILFVPGGDRPVSRVAPPTVAAAPPARSAPPPGTAGDPPAAARPAPPPRPTPPAPTPSPPPRVDTPSAPAPSASARPLRWPAEGEVLRGFGTGPAGESRGIDLGLPQGTAVRAAAAGTVTYAGTPAEAYGPLVILEHDGGLFTVYGNLGAYRVERGQRLDAGATVGTSGSKHGDLPPHLHFEVRRGQQAVDPLLFLPPR